MKVLDTALLASLCTRLDALLRKALEVPSSHNEQEIGGGRRGRSTVCFLIVPPVMLHYILRFTWVATAPPKRSVPKAVME
eukprot:2678847-Amphidinium_carterae.1